MGPVERVLVLGIVVVIVAILGIAVWGASGDDTDGTDGLARDGGVMVDAGRPESGTPLAPFTQTGLAQDSLGGARGSATQPSVQPGKELALLQTMDERKAEAESRRAMTEAAGGATPTDGGGVASPGLPGADVPASGGASGALALNLSEPVGAMPVGAQGVDAAAREAAGGPGAPGDATPAPAGKKAATKKVESGLRGGTTHVVVTGDSLWRIANHTYGDSNVREHIDAILAENPALDEDAPLIPGAKIKLPAINVKGDVVRLPAEKAAAEIDGGTYKVKAGDTLSTIAQRELGAASRWQEIYDLNRARLSDPGRIVEGMTLTLPHHN